LDQGEETHPDGVLRVAGVHGYDQWLVLRPDDTDYDWPPVAQAETRRVLARIRRQRQLGLVTWRPQKHTGVQGNDPFRRRQQRVDVNLLNLREIRQQPAEPDQDSLQ